MGTGTNLLAKLDRNTSSFVKVENNTPGEFSIRYDVVRNLFGDRERNLWVSTNKGLFYFNPGAQFFHSMANKKVETPHIVQM